MTDITIQPGFSAFYYSFYIVGLRRLFPKARFHYTNKGFPPFSPHRLLARVDGARLAVCSYDATNIDGAMLEWCDVYGKSNPESDGYPDLPEGLERKIHPIGPSFAVTAWPFPRLAVEAVRQYWPVRAHIASGPDRTLHFRYYLGQLTRRAPEQEYAHSPSRPDYVYFTSSLWDARNMELNLGRARFIRACRRVEGVRFEGGLLVRPGSETRGCEDVAITEETPIRSYLAKTRASALTFNTPAVHQCHGWKLGEFLALGKAMLSTPPVRRLPAPLVHGEHWHLVDGSEESIEDGVRRVLGDPEYRHRLERNARAYYDQWLAPQAVMQRLLLAARGSRG